jgi:hypothetical protein
MMMPVVVLAAAGSFGCVSARERNDCHLQYSFSRTFTVLLKCLQLKVIFSQKILRWEYDYTLTSDAD